MAQHNNLGKEGETFAVSYLKQVEYTILATNWRYGKEEIDIIARHAQMIVFIEVKTRRDPFYADAEKIVSLQKQQYLIHAANAYLQQQQINFESRFDVMILSANGNEFIVNHIENAFYPTLSI